MAAPDPSPKAPVAPASVAAARRLPDFLAPNGWLAGITKEIRRIEHFKAWHIASATEVRADVAKYGASRVSIGYTVAVLVCKMDSAGGARAAHIVNKFRVTLADKREGAGDILTHSNCVDDISNRLITAIAPAIGALQDSIDVGGAYFHGVPPSMENGGRCLYVRIPTWLSDLFPHYPQRGSGGMNFLRVTGNMPGRCDAGRIWQQRFDEFLRGYGLTQLLTDRRVWTRHDTHGSLIVHDHVDDSRLTATTPQARLNFHTAWAQHFNEQIEIRPLAEDFTGLRHTRVDAFTTAISCGGVLKRLETLLLGQPATGTLSCAYPLPAIALGRINQGPTARHPLVPHRSELVAPILGTIGFIAGIVRPDAYFAYCVLSRHAGPARITTYVDECILRLGRYLLLTKDYCLNLTTPQLHSHPDGTTTLDLFETYVDSSHGNGDNGTSYGGFVLASRALPPASLPHPAPLPPPDAEDGVTELTASAPPPPGTPHPCGGGALAWKCSAPLDAADSSAGCESKQAVTAYKYTLAARILLTELAVGVGPKEPTTFYLDAQTVIDGTNCERLDKRSRWMALRYAMLRWGIACGTIRPVKRPSARNVSDGLTKNLTGKLFYNCRARLLGYPVPYPDL